MLYDPDFARDVYTDRDTTLDGEDLSETERDWLTEPDPRAYRTDAFRRSRSLAALMEEFPAAAAFVLRRGREGSIRPETSLLDAFFSSPVFHRCIRDGSSMVFAFGDYLVLEAHEGVAADPRVAPLARLEAAIARVRRADPPAGLAPDAERLALAPRARVVELPAGTSELHHRLSRALTARGRTALQSLLDPRWSLPVLLDLANDQGEHLLVERVPEEGGKWAEAPVRYAPVTDELYHLLRAAETPITRPELEAKTRELGAEPGEEAEIISNLIAEDLLVAAGEPAPRRGEASDPDRQV
jgi:hypothetical protein